MRILLASLLMLSLQGTSRLEIVVRDANTREVIAGVPVALFVGVPNGLADQVVFTDPRGLATFAGLNAGRHTIALGENYRTEPDSLPWPLELDGRTSRRFDVPVKRIAHVTGRIVDQNGAPAVSNFIDLLSSVYLDGRRTLQSVGTSSTGREGTFNAFAPYGEYYLRIVSKSPWSITYYPGVTDLSAAQKVIVRDSNVSVGDLQLPSLPRYKVSGTVLHSPEDSGGTLTVYLAHDNPVMEEEPFETMVSSRRVSPTELQFELNDIPAGSYDFYAVLRDRTNFGSVGKENLRVGAGDVDGLNIALKPMVRITGRILMKGVQSKLPQNLRIATPSMGSYPRLLFDEYSRTAVLPGTSGEFAVRYLIDGGRYGISLQRLPADAYISDIRLGRQSILADGSFVASPTQDAFEIQIATPGGIVRGTVRDASGKLTETATVVAVPDFARRRNSAFYRKTTTDARGQFTIQGLAPGEYQLFAFPVPPPPGAEEDPAFHGLFESRSTTVRASAGIATETNLRLIQ